MPLRVKTIFLAILSVLFTTTFLKAQEQSDSLVRLDYGKTAELVVINGQNVRKVIGPAQFMHNNTYMLCDTALWNIDTQIIDAIGNVSIIQEGTVLTSDKMVYIIDDDLAQFRGSMVQLEDSDHNMLRTSYLDYNTKDSVAVFDNGGAMRDKDGQIVESIKGTYDAKIKLFTFTDDVNMFTDSIFVKTTHLEYESERNFATFGIETDAWQEDNMLSANAGWYDRGRELFFFRNNVHLMTDTQEGWSDSLYYNRSTVTVEMLGRAQVTDTSRNTSAVAGRMIYEDSLSSITLLRDPAVIADVGQSEEPDTLYFRADTIVYYSKMMFQLADDFKTVSEQRLADLYVDPVGTYRKKAAEAAAKAAEEAAMDDPNYRPSGAGLNGLSEGPAGQPDDAGGPQPEKNAGPEPPGLAPDGKMPLSGSSGEDGTANEEFPDESDSLTISADSLYHGLDSLVFGSDSLFVGIDSLVFGPDSLAAESDSLAGGSGSVRRGADDFRPGAGSFGSGPDSLRFGLDSLMFGTDSLGFGADSLGFGADSLEMEPLDSAKVGFVWAVGDVRLYKEGMQIVCDSLEYCDLDSLARLYKDPVIWNDITQQYTADSVTSVIRNRTLERASLMSNSYIIIEEEAEKYYNQIKSTETLAYFDSAGELSRFDALGTATCLFFLREDDVVATVNKTDSKMLYGTFADGSLQRVYYFEDAKSDAFPVVQLPQSERTFKGFNWIPERRPVDRNAVTTATLRPTMREEYASRPRAAFNNTNLYFPGYIQGIYTEIEQRDSLQKIRARERKIAEAEQEALEEQLLRDSLARMDSIFVADSLIRADSLARADSIKKVEQKVRRDSLAKVDSIKAAVEAQRIPTKEELKEKAKAEKVAAKKARKDEREKRWEEKDRLDAEKAAAKEEKKAAKLREKKRKYLQKRDAEDAKDRRELEKYFDKFSAKQSVVDEKKAAKAAKKAEKKAAKAARKAAKKGTKRTSETAAEVTEQVMEDVPGTSLNP